MKRQQCSAADLALLARLFDWRGALVVVQPATVIRWHRACWRLFWRVRAVVDRARESGNGSDLA